MRTSLVSGALRFYPSRRRAELRVGLDTWRANDDPQRRSGLVALDQLRTVDTERLVRRLGRLDVGTVTLVLHALQEMFAA